MRIHYQDFMIFFTFLLFWISIQFGQIIEDSIAYVIVLSIGIIHGSNDFTILKKQQNDSTSFLRTSIYYILLIISCIICYVINSFVAILFFIVLSSFHFGEQHLENKIGGSKIVKNSTYILYGLLIFSLIFIENIEQVDQIMINLTGASFPVIWIQSLFIFSSSILIVLYGCMVLKKINSKINIVREIFYLLLLYLVFKTSSLILGFAIYFVLWHSIPSILDQTKFLSGQPTIKTITEYFKTAFFYWVISISGLLLAYYYLSENFFNSIIFLVLFSVTAPHVWVMNRMKK